MTPIRVALPLGIGDCHWPAQKLRGLSAYHGHRPIHAFVNESANHRSVGYLKALPCVEKAEFSVFAPISITGQLPPDYRDDKWSTLHGSAGWNGFDYVFCANGHIEQGIPIDRWMPELATQYTFDYAISDLDLRTSHALMYEPEVLIYPSAEGPNRAFHNHWWTVGDWVEVIRLFNAAGIVPTVVGANTAGDMTYANRLVIYRPDVDFKSVVGLTSIGAMLDMVKRCRVWVGLNSGFGIAAASMSTPTLMLWADNRWPLGKAAFDPKMQTAWLHESQLDRYETLSFGSPDMTSSSVATTAMRIMR